MNLISLLLWIVMGGLAGWLASFVMGTREQQSTLIDVALGIAGAFVGGYLFSALGSVGFTGFNLWSGFVAFVGAVIILAVARLFRNVTA